MKIQLVDNFWSPRQELNRKTALIYQWEQYSNCGTLENFHLAAQKKHSGRKGFFYTDSDLHKWADAVSRTQAHYFDETLDGLLEQYIDLMKHAQEPDGYIYTRNQIYFPGQRWLNLHIEHELYSMGHFIEAAISHFTATGKNSLLSMAVKTADLIVRDFDKITSAKCPGHQEIEIALIKLYRTTGKKEYLNRAEQFLRKRGTGSFFGLKLLINALSHNLRNRRVKKADGDEHLSEPGFNLTENIKERESRFLAFRSFIAFISGKYHQQHKSFMKQTVPEGHSVRWAYMMYAAAMLENEKDGSDLSFLLSQSWKNLVEKKMYITGGIGSLPVIEGFGRNYELNNEFSYSETCAAIGSVYWNNEMLKKSLQAPYADMVERQLYNAALAGISQDGKKYFYRNPLESRGELERRPWFDTACCPSNISRLWADLSELIFIENNDAIYINQYIGSRITLEKHNTEIELKSGFPWTGRVQIGISSRESVKINLRIPGWAQSWIIRVNSEIHSERTGEKKAGRLYTDIMKSAFYSEVELEPGTGHLIDIEFPMEATVNRSEPRVKENRGRIAISRGPLVYCIESEQDIDRPVNTSSLEFDYDNQSFTEKTGYLSDGEITMIPYFLWGNRGKKKMKVWFERKQTGEINNS